MAALLSRRLHNASGCPHRDSAEEIVLADIYAAMTEDVVGGGDVKMEVGHRKMVEIAGACHMTLFRAKRKSDLTLRGAVDLPGVERLQKGDRLGNACLEVGDRL